VKKRPQIKVGDVVRLNYKGMNKRGYKHLRDLTMVVTKVDGDGVEKYSKIKCMINNPGGRIHEFLSISRGYLWSTGHNVKNKNDVPTVSTPADDAWDRSWRAANGLRPRPKTGKPCSCPWDLVKSQGCQCGGC
jgi:hypothetical protein